MFPTERANVGFFSCDSIRAELTVRMTSTAHALKHEQLTNERDFISRLLNESEQKGHQGISALVTVAHSSARLAAKARRELIAATTDHERVRGENVDRIVTLRGLPGTLGWGHLRAHLKEKHNIECNRVDKGPGWTLAILTLNMSRDIALKALKGANIEGNEIKATPGEPTVEEMEEQKTLQASAVATMDTSNFHKKHSRDHKVEKGNKKQRR